MNTLKLKPNHKAVRAYYEAISNLSALGASHEGAVSPAFAALLSYCASQFNWTLVQKYPMKRNSHTIFPDGALVDRFNLVHGVWEAKDTTDDLEKEVRKKLAAGYPKQNIVFQAPDRAVIWQDGAEVFNEDVSKPERLIEGLRIFFEYQPPAFEQWQQAVEEFKLKVRDLASGLLELIEKERESNKRFTQAFDEFNRLCLRTINPNIATEAVEKMLVQHMLTERIFRTVFKNVDFVKRNAIAAEIEKVIDALTSQYFSRHDFLKSLDRFYIAIETTAATIDEFAEKQGFLNSVYEKFFQGFSAKVADTHGIVYTPQPIVKFMVKSVENILQKELGRSLSDESVHIIDPFVGTGNFIVWSMREIQRSKLPYKYADEVHCNEVMLLPYYIASMNIEHEYYELTSTYQAFEGICLVDTFELAEGKQLSLFTEENTARVERQQNSPIFVIMGNPPYNAGQVNENDNNKNRKYPAIDKRVSQTYGKASKATLVRKLNDPYVKAIRWASDRIGDEGIVAFVTNNSFVSDISFDGMRKHLGNDFDTIHILDLGGNVRKNPKLSGTTHNVFGIQVGVSINILVKKRNRQSQQQAKIYYARVDEFWRKEEKYDFLTEKEHLSNIEWRRIQPDARNDWLTGGMAGEFESFTPMGTKEGKRVEKRDVETIFKLFSLGVATNRDEWVYAFQEENLERKMEEFIRNYNFEVFRFSQESEVQSIDNFVNNDPSFVKWTDRLKAALQQRKILTFDSAKLRPSMYRPFAKQALYFDHLLNQRTYRQPLFFPTTRVENRVICVSGIGSSKPFQAFMANIIPCLDMLEKTQCFPFYTYAEDGSKRRENITDWALNQFRRQYNDDRISKWDVFHYVYAILHHPEYLDRYAANLKRELPRIPLGPDFWSFAKAGAELAELHVNYEQEAEYPFVWLENKDVPLNWRVEKMKLSKDKAQLIYNDFLTLGAIPPEAFKYRLGNRSALEWVVDQYEVKTHKRSGIVSDPNRLDNPQYIVRLIGKVVTVSLQTMKIVKGLPKEICPTTQENALNS